MDDYWLLKNLERKWRYYGRPLEKTEKIVKFRTAIFLSSYQRSEKEEMCIAEKRYVRKRHPPTFYVFPSEIPVDKHEFYQL